MTSGNPRILVRIAITANPDFKMPALRHDRGNIAKCTFRNKGEFHRLVGIVIRQLREVQVPGEALPEATFKRNDCIITISTEHYGKITPSTLLRESVKIFYGHDLPSQGKTVETGPVRRRRIPSRTGAAFGYRA